MTLNVDLYLPSCQVILHKTGGRSIVSGTLGVSSRFAGQPVTIDLTPMLGESGGVRTTKSVKDPAGGFTVTLTDQNHVTGDALYDSIEPMDIVIIKMARGGQFGGERVIMRGMVSRVQRREAMGDDGKPAHSLVISGQDFGKVWQITQVVPLADKVLGAGKALFSNKPLLRFALEGESTITVENFLRGVIETTLNPVLARVAQIPGSSRVPTSFILDNKVINERISIPGIGVDQSRTVYELLKKFTDVGVWNEMFVEDREDGVYIVMRPVPTVDLVTGKLIAYDGVPTSQGGGEDKIGGIVDVIDVPGTQVVSCDAERTDDQVANFFFTDSARMGTNTTPLMKVFSNSEEKDSVDFRQYPNSDVALYGDRELIQQVSTCPGVSTKGTSGNPEKVVMEETDSWVEHLRKRRRILAANNKDNVVFEAGTLELMGRSDIRPGTFLRVSLGASPFLVYAQSVDHSFRPFGSFTTSVRFVRGDRFARHLRADGGSFNRDRRG